MRAVRLHPRQRRLAQLDNRGAGDRRRTGSCKFIEATPYMRPAKREPDVARVGGFAVAGITVDLQDTLEAFKMGDGPFGFAVGRIDIG
jgi:hypothetical protein